MEFKNNIKNNWREYTLLALGILIILAPYVVIDTLFGWANVVLGAAVALIGIWPLFPKKKLEKLI